MDQWEIVLPPEVPAVVGKEMNIYFDNLMIADADRYYVDVICDIGMQQNERWTVVPDTPGDYLLTIEIYENPVTKLTSASTIVKVSGADTGPGMPKTLLFIGDSTTAAGQYTEELLNLFSSESMEITLVGTKGELSNRHEGRSGWRIDTFYGNSESPFVFDGKFDFSRYMQCNGYPQPECVIIHLGINDVFYEVDDSGVRQVIADEMPMLEQMIASIREYRRGTKIGIMVTIPPSRFQDSFGFNYKSEQTRWRYKRNLMMWNKALVTRFVQRQDDGIHLVPVNVNLDTVHNMAAQQMAVNSRSSRQIIRQTDGVHPAAEGYYQMADVLYYWLKSLG